MLFIGFLDLSGAESCMRIEIFHIVNVRIILKSRISLIYFLSFFPLTDIMDLRHQSSAMCIIVGGRTHTPVVCNESREPHTSHYPSGTVTKRNNQQLTHTSHYPSLPVDIFKIWIFALISNLYSSSVVVVLLSKNSPADS